MLSRERVIEVIEGRAPDRVPLYGWVRANLAEPIATAFGSVEAFEDRYEFDFAHLFGGPGCYRQDDLKAMHGARAPTPRDLLAVPMTDPDALEVYANIREQIRHHKEERGRFVYVQTPGIFEANNGPLGGIENHLLALALYPDDLPGLYRRQADWNRRFALNCIELGVDMVHVSDDWGGQHGLLFSPETWWRLIYPFHRLTAQAVKKAGAYLSLHSDGNINGVVDGVVDLGYDVVHPWQESAGMSYDTYWGQYSRAFVLMGGLDVQTTIGFGKLDVLRSEIERVLRRFARGGLLFCTSHFVQEHCTVEELQFAFDSAYGLVREVCR
jgi:uroporphyrinogen decarboxylase